MKHFGWARPLYSEKEYLSIIAQFSPPELEFTADVSGQRFAAWDYAKQTVGDFLMTYQQQVGDCTGAGECQGLNYQQCVEIALGDWEEFQYLHTSYSYAMSRMVSQWRISGDGASAAAMMVAAQKYGHLALSATPYSGTLSRRWGERPGPPKQYRDLAQPQLMGQPRRITSYTQLRDAMIGSKCCGMIASSRGFADKLQESKGKSWFTGNADWPHNLAIIAVDDKDGSVNYLNSWGPRYHGRQLDGPQGSGWVQAEVFDKTVKNRTTECFVFGPFNGWKIRDDSSIG